MKDGEGPALKPAARKAEIKAQRDNTEILEVCESHLRQITVYHNVPFCKYIVLK